jgi:hypothetical protein
MHAMNVVVALPGNGHAMGRRSLQPPWPRGGRRRRSVVWGRAGLCHAREARSAFPRSQLKLGKGLWQNAFSIWRSAERQGATLSLLGATLTPGVGTPPAAMDPP